MNIIVPIIAFWRRLTIPSDYAVSRVDLEYFVTDAERAKRELMDTFWRHQCDFWEWFSHRDHLNYLVSLNEPEDYNVTKKPDCVTRVITRVKYWYDGKPYKYISNNLNHEWPPAKPAGMSFSIPISHAHLCDADGKPKRDVTTKIKKYGGPKGDFHGELVPLRDLFTYTEDVLQNEFPILRVVNALGLQKEVSTVSDSTLNLVA